MNCIYDDNDATLVLKYNQNDIPQLLYKNQQIKATQQDDQFIVFKNLQFDTYYIQTQAKTISLKLNNQLTCYNLLNSRLFTHAFGDEIVIICVNYHWKYGMSQNPKSGFIKFSDFQPLVKFEANCDYYVLRLSETDRIEFQLENQQFTVYENDINEQDFCYGDFQFQLFRMKPIEFETISKHQIKTVETTHVLTLGHRGNGPNKDYTPFANAQGIKRIPINPLAENTLLSYQSCKHFDGIELDVMMTQDKQLVINHNFGVDSEYGDLAINSLQLQQFKQIGIKHVLSPSFGIQDDFQFEKLKKQNVSIICDQLTRRRPTFREVLQHAPDYLICVEIKYPSKDCKSIGSQYWSRAVLIHEILHELEAFPDRKIQFSSFDPGVVLILKNIQNKYPVSFLNNGFGEEIFCADGNFNNKYVKDFRIAIPFCLKHGIAGMTTSVKMLMEHQDWIESAIKQGLKIFTWGSIPGSNLIETQKQIGILGIMYDCLHTMK